MIGRIQNVAGECRCLFVVVRPQLQIRESEDAAAVGLAATLQIPVFVVQLKADAGEWIAAVVRFRDLDAADPPL